MSAHNYDGDMLTDEVAQVHRSPGFITSNLAPRGRLSCEIVSFSASVIPIAADGDRGVGATPSREFWSLRDLTLFRTARVRGLRRHGV